MDQELKAKWCAALRSGEFKQGKRFLYLDGSHCCLGVLREIQTPGTRYVFEGASTLYTNHDGGLSWEQQDYLANTLNDKQGKTFPEIADYIEKNL